MKLLTIVALPRGARREEVPGDGTDDSPRETGAACPPGNDGKSGSTRRADQGIRTSKQERQRPASCVSREKAGQSLLLSLEGLCHLLPH